MGIVLGSALPKGVLVNGRLHPQLDLQDVIRGDTQRCKAVKPESVWMIDQRPCGEKLLRTRTGPDRHLGTCFRLTGRALSSVTSAAIGRYSYRLTGLELGVL